MTNSRLLTGGAYDIFAEAGLRETIITDKALLERQSVFLSFLRPLSENRQVVFRAIKYDAVKREGESCLAVRERLLERYGRLSTSEAELLRAHIATNALHTTFAREFVLQAKKREQGDPRAQWMAHAYLLYYQDQYGALWKGEPYRPGFFMGVANRWFSMDSAQTHSYEVRALRNKALIAQGDPTMKDPVHIQHALREKHKGLKADVMRARRHFVTLLELSGKGK